MKCPKCGAESEESAFALSVWEGGVEIELICSECVHEVIIWVDQKDFGDG